MQDSITPAYHDKQNKIDLPHFPVPLSLLLGEKNSKMDSDYQQEQKNDWEQLHQLMKIHICLFNKNNLNFVVVIQHIPNTMLTTKTSITGDAIFNSFNHDETGRHMIAHIPGS